MQGMGCILRLTCELASVLIGTKTQNQDICCCAGIGMSTGPDSWREDVLKVIPCSVLDSAEVDFRRIEVVRCGLKQ